MSAPAAELDDLYGGIDEDMAEPSGAQPPAAAAPPAAKPAAAAPAPPPSRKQQQQQRRTPAEHAAEAAAEAERAARDRLTPAAPLTAAREVPVIREGDYAVFEINGEKLSVQHVRAAA